jgi:glutamyl-tRNA synthetase
LTSLKDEILQISELKADLAKSTLEKVTAQLGIATGKILQALRVAITGIGTGPDLMMIMEILGKDEIAKRIDYAISVIKVKVA